MKLWLVRIADEEEGGDVDGASARRGAKFKEIQWFGNFIRWRWFALRKWVTMKNDPSGKSGLIEALLGRPEKYSTFLPVNSRLLILSLFQSPLSPSSGTSRQKGRKFGGNSKRMKFQAPYESNLMSRRNDNNPTYRKKKKKKRRSLGERSRKCTDETIITLTCLPYFSECDRVPILVHAL